MKRYVIATHGGLAVGIQSTVELFVGDKHDITYMSAYLENNDSIESQIKTYTDDIKPEDQIVVFTDLFGGSVSQKFLEVKAAFPNVYVVAGFNLPLILEIILASDEITSSFINNKIKDAREGMKEVVVPNDSENDEDFFD